MSRWIPNNLPRIESKLKIRIDHSEWWFEEWSHERK